MSAATGAGYRMPNSLRYRKSDDPGQTYMTPEYALGPIRADLGGSIDLDPCTIAENPTGAARFFTVDEDGLAQPWNAARIAYCLDCDWTGDAPMPSLAAGYAAEQHEREADHAGSSPASAVLSMEERP